MELIVNREFTGKYLSKNIAKQLLIKHYFHTIYKTLRNLKLPLDCIPPRVLEIGCGAGFSTQYLTKMFSNMESSEYRGDLIEQAKERNPTIQIRQESIYNLKRDDNSFDMVVVLEVLEHLKYPWVALLEVKRVSSKYCLFSVPYEPLWSLVHVCGDDPGHIWHLRKEDFECLISEYFTIISRATSFPWQIILAEK